MSSLLPSELARLVLGYLEENGCQQASRHLLRELPALSECAQLLKKGRKVTRRIGNRTLHDMLTDYADSKEHILDCLNSNPASFKNVSKFDTLYEQVKSLTSDIVKNKYAVKQRMSLGVLGRARQRVHTSNLQRDLHHTSRLSETHEISATSPETLPGSSHHHHHKKPMHVVDVMADDASYSSNSLTTPPSRLVANPEDPRHELSSSSFIHQDSQSTPQRRKGRAKRRSHGGEPSTPGASPVMDAEASIMKILNNLYENTALHEKIAATINRELGGQGKILLSPRDSQNKPSRDALALNIISGRRAGEYSGGINRFHEGSGSAGGGGGGVGEVGSRQSSAGGDPGVIHELDNIVTNIISETTADPEFETLLDEVFGAPSFPASRPEGSSQEVTAAHPCSHSSPVHSQTIPPNPLPHLNSSSITNASLQSACMTPPCALPHSASATQSTLNCPVDASGNPVSASTQLSHSLDTSLEKLSMKEKRRKERTDMDLHLSGSSRNSRRMTKFSNLKSAASRLESIGHRQLKESSFSVAHSEKGCVVPPDTHSHSGSPTERKSGRGKRDRMGSGKKKKQLHRDDDKKFGEQLLKEFAEFQSSRPDKCGESDGADTSEVTMPSGELKKDVVSSSTEHGSNNDNNICGAGGEELCNPESGSMEPSKHTSPENIIDLPPVNLNGCEEGLANQFDSSKAGSDDLKMIHKSDVKIAENMEGTQLPVHRESAHEHCRKPLHIELYGDDPHAIEPVGECMSGGGGLLTQATPSSALKVMSTTIPGIGRSSAQQVPPSPSKDDQYTLTELRPLVPLPYIEGSYVVEESTGILYPCSEKSSAPSNHQPLSNPSLYSSFPHSNPAPPAPSGMCQSQFPLLSSFNQVMHQSHGQNSISSHQVLSEVNDPPTRILLPPVTQREYEEGRVITVSAANQSEPTMMIVQFPETGKAPPQPLQQTQLLGTGQLQPQPQPVQQTPSLSSLPDQSIMRLGNVDVSKFKGPSLETLVKENMFPKKECKANRGKNTVNKVGHPLVLVAPKPNLTSLQPSSEGLCPNEMVPNLQPNTVCTLANDITISIPNIVATSLAKVKTNRNTKLVTAKNSKQDSEVGKEEVTSGRVTRSRSKAALKQSKLSQQQTNDIIATAFSVALNTASPEKIVPIPQVDVQGVGVSPSNSTILPSSPVKHQDTCDTEELPDLTSEWVQELISESVVTGTSPVVEHENNEAHHPETETENHHDNNKSNNDNNSTCLSAGQKKSTLKDMTDPSLSHNSLGEKYSTGRSPELKALLHTVSQSISPSKKIIALKRLSTNFKSPRVGVVSKRGSQSTPSRKKSSHIRALDFGTPQKMRGHFKTPKKRAVASLKFSPKNMPKLLSPKKKLLKRILEEKEEISVGSNVVEESNNNVPPSSLRSTEPIEEGRSAVDDVEEDDSLVLRMDDDDESTEGNDAKMESAEPCSRREEKQKMLSSEAFRSRTKTSSLIMNSKTKVRNLQTPCKASTLLDHDLPLCLEPPTPLDTVQKTPGASLQDGDLNTPLLPMIPKSPHNKTSPLLKDYPQGPYSNSSMSTSYYMPSERSLTDSEGHSPCQMSTVWEKTLEETLGLSSAINDLAANSTRNLFNNHEAVEQERNAAVTSSPKLSKRLSSSPTTSTTKLTGKVMGEIIEQEMSRLFSGTDDNPMQTTSSQVSDANVHSDIPSSKGTPGNNDSDFTIPSKGKQGKKKRVPSQKYQCLNDSTCSEEGSLSQKKCNLLGKRKSKSPQSVSFHTKDCSTKASMTEQQEDSEILETSGSKRKKVNAKVTGKTHKSGKHQSTKKSTGVASSLSEASDPVDTPGKDQASIPTNLEKSLRKSFVIDKGNGKPWRVDDGIATSEHERAPPVGSETTTHSTETPSRVYSFKQGTVGRVDFMIPDSESITPGGLHVCEGEDNCNTDDPPAVSSKESTAENVSADKSGGCVVTSPLPKSESVPVSCKSVQEECATPISASKTDGKQIQKDEEPSTLIAALKTERKQNQNDDELPTLHKTSGNSSPLSSLVNEMLESEEMETRRQRVYNVKDVFGSDSSSTNESEAEHDDESRDEKRKWTVNKADELKGDGNKAPVSKADKAAGKRKREAQTNKKAVVKHVSRAKLQSEEVKRRSGESGGNREKILNKNVTTRRKEVGKMKNEVERKMASKRNITHKCLDRSEEDREETEETQETAMGSEEEDTEGKKKLDDKKVNQGICKEVRSSGKKTTKSGRRSPSLSTSKRGGVRRSDRLARQRNPGGRGKKTETVTIEEIVIEATCSQGIVGSENVPREDVIDEVLVFKMPGRRGRGTTRRRGGRRRPSGTGSRRGNNSTQGRGSNLLGNGSSPTDKEPTVSPGNGLSLHVVTAEITPPTTRVTPDTTVSHTDDTLHQSQQNKTPSPGLKKSPRSPFTIWGSGLISPTAQSIASNVIEQDAQVVRACWARKVTGESDVNVTDTEGEGRRGRKNVPQLKKGSPEHHPPHEPTVTSSSGCARTTDNLMEIRSRCTPSRRHISTEDLGEVHNITPKSSRRFKLADTPSDPPQDAAYTSPAADNQLDGTVSSAKRLSFSPPRILQSVEAENSPEHSHTAESMEVQGPPNESRIYNASGGNIPETVSGFEADLPAEVRSNTDNTAKQFMEVEKLTLLGEDSEGVSTCANAIMNLLANKSIQELEKEMEIMEQSCHVKGPPDEPDIDTLQNTAKGSDFDLQNSDDIDNNHTSHKETTTTTASVKGTQEDTEINVLDSSQPSGNTKFSVDAEERIANQTVPTNLQSPSSVESSGDMWQSCEEHCLLSYKALPSTPEKNRDKICHSIVRDRKALVAFPLPPKLPKSISSIISPTRSLEGRRPASAGKNSPVLPIEAIDDTSGQAGTSVENCRHNKGSESSSQHSQKASGKSEKGTEMSDAENRLSTNFVQGNGASNKKSVIGSELESGTHKQKDQSVKNESLSNLRSRHEFQECVTDGVGKSLTDKYECQKSVLQSSHNLMEEEQSDDDDDEKDDDVPLEKRSEIDTMESCSRWVETLSEVRGDEGDDDDTKLEDEEDDSDVLRIEEPSETEAEDDHELVDTINLQVTEFIDIFSMNLEKPKRLRAKRARISPKVLQGKNVKSKTAGKKKPKPVTRDSEMNSDSIQKKLKGSKRTVSSCTEKESSSNNATQHTCTQTASESAVAVNRSTVDPVTSHSGSGCTDSDIPHNKSTNDSSVSGGKGLKRPRLEETPPTPTEEELKMRPRQKRRITPTRIGDIEKYKKEFRARWSEEEEEEETRRGMPFEHVNWTEEWNSRRKEAVRRKKTDGQDNQEKDVGPKLGFHRREGPVHSHSGHVGGSERSVSSVSSASPGRLLISESPRALDSPQNAHSCPTPCRTRTVPHTGVPVTEVASLTTANSSQPSASSLSTVSCSSTTTSLQPRVLTSQSSLTQSRLCVPPHTSRQQGLLDWKLGHKLQTDVAPDSYRASQSYLVESETSVEPDEEAGPGRYLSRRQRKARQMADELHSGGSLELVQNVSRQLAIVTNHLSDNTQRSSLLLSEESTQSLSSMPPTPGKHLFVPPTPAPTSVITSAAAAATVSASSSSTSNSPILPFKKRKKVMTQNHEQVRNTVLVQKKKKLALRKVDVTKFLNKIHKEDQ